MGPFPRQKRPLPIEWYNSWYCLPKMYIYSKSIEEQRKVVFSDESRFELFPNRRVRVWRTLTEKFLPACVAPAVQQGRELCMVWGCITSEGSGLLHFVEGTMNNEKYIETVEEVMFPSVYGLLGDNFILQRDNAPCYCSRMTKARFSKQGNRSDGLASLQS